MIYFVQPADGGPVKIGHSQDVETRIAGLQAKSIYNRPLVLLATMKGGRDEEKAIHAKFAHLRIGVTEQFQPAEDLMAFIGRPLFASREQYDRMPVTMKALTTIHASKARTEWLDEFVRFAGMPSRSSTFWRAIAIAAKADGFTKPLPK